MTNQHPITPPLELVHQWVNMLSSRSDHHVFSLASQWGADQELEACCEWLRANGYPGIAFELNNLRRPRPKPPTDKELALAELDRLIARIPTEGAMTMAESIRKALEALPND
jgi:hypothetical protein